MATTRGRCRQDIKRAMVLAHHITDRLAWIADEYKEYEKFTEGVEEVAKSAVIIEEYLRALLTQVP